MEKNFLKTKKRGGFWNNCSKHAEKNTIKFLKDCCYEEKQRGWKYKAFRNRQKRCESVRRLNEKRKEVDRFRKEDTAATLFLNKFLNSNNKMEALRFDGDERLTEMERNIFIEGGYTNRRDHRQNHKKTRKQNRK